MQKVLENWIHQYIKMKIYHIVSRVYSGECKGTNTLENKSSVVIHADMTKKSTQSSQKMEKKHDTINHSL